MPCTNAHEWKPSILSAVGLYEEEGGQGRQLLKARLHQDQTKSHESGSSPGSGIPCIRLTSVSIQLDLSLFSLRL